jgi:hypothetical protein
MSRVTNVILTSHVGSQDRPDEEIASVNRFLRNTEGGGNGEFKDVTSLAGGPKNMECRVYLSALNHASTEIIIKAVQQAPWRDREMVQVFVKEQEEELFKLRHSGLEMNGSISVNFAPEELRIVCNALNEVCNGLDLRDEFETRIGSTLDAAQELLARLGAVEQN